MSIQKLAVLITCHNRKKNTLSCLTHLEQQINICKSTLHIYITDDGSNDGTNEALRKYFPNVHVIQGNGNLYWCGGMRLAWDEAMREDYDAYLWLNDDTILFSDAISSLLKCARQIRQETDKDGIIVGSCHDFDAEKHTYGGRDRSGTLIRPGNTPQQCVLMNGNVVLVPRKILKAIGNLSQDFVHLFGDYDYGLRAIKAGFKLWVPPGFQGQCSVNTPSPWTDPKVPLHERWKSLHSPKGLPPHEYYIYARRHHGIKWPFVLAKLYLRVLLPRLYNALKYSI